MSACTHVFTFVCIYTYTYKQVKKTCIHTCSYSLASLSQQPLCHMRSATYTQLRVLCFDRTQVLQASGMLQVCNRKHTYACSLCCCEGTIRQAHQHTCIHQHVYTYMCTCRKKAKVRKLESWALKTLSTWHPAMLCLLVHLDVRAC